MCATVSGYAERVITCPDDYCGLEIEGVRSFRKVDGSEFIEVWNSNPEFFSVYARENEGLAFCIGDFQTHDAAIAYAVKVKNQYSGQAWDIWDRYSHYQALKNS